MHVLSTPPAFVLSQDQTLYNMVSKQALACLNLHRAIFSIASFPAPPVIDSTRQNGFVLWQSHLNELAFWCFLFVTLFNLQGTRPVRRNIAIILAFIRFVKNFFQKFFPNVRLVSLSARPPADSFVTIPNLSPLVKTFFASPAYFCCTAPGPGRSAGFPRKNMLGKRSCRCYNVP